MKPKNEAFKTEMMTLQDKLEDQDIALVELAKEAKDVAENKETEKEKEKEIAPLEIIIKAFPELKAKIEEWRNMYGDIYATMLDEDEVYIYRYITRAEYKELLTQFRNANDKLKSEEMIDEFFVQRCLLYPSYSTEFKAASPAGVIPTIATQIKLVSRFMSEQIAMQLISKI